LGSSVIAAAQICSLCQRPLIAGPSVDEHHLVPRSHGGKETHRIHRICHRKIHSVLTERQLAQSYNTWEALRAHPAIASFISWVQKKPPEYYDNSRTARDKRG
jgi:hypothetical protein